MQEIQNKEFSQRVFQQFMDLYITPAVMARQEKGELPKPLDLFGAQVIFYPDGRNTEVRINREVKALGKTKVKTAVKKGEQVSLEQIGKIEKIMLTEEDDPDCGHMTMLRLNGDWNIAFDFIYNKSISTEHLKSAEQFYSMAEQALKKIFWSPFIDNLFSACELTAKAYLLSEPDKKFRKKTKHTAIHAKYNRHAKLGNVKEEHKNIFNKLASLRGSARYLNGNFKIEKTEAKEMLSVVKEMMAFGTKIVG